MKHLFIVISILILLLITGCSPASPIQINTPAPGSTEDSVPNSEVTVPGVTIRVNAPGPNPQVNTPNQLGNVAGLLMGIWHGFIAPVTLGISFVNPGVQMYEVHNNGSQYNLGFLVGLILFAVVIVLLVARIRKRRS